MKVRERSCYSAVVNRTRGKETLEEEVEMKEIKLEQQHQEALLRHFEMVLEDKRKHEKVARRKQRNDHICKERSKLIHNLEKSFRNS